MPAPYYTTVALVRTELGVDSTVLPDADALALIADAEDMIDEMLGLRSVDETTGRKVVQADEDAWRWTKLGRATVKLCRVLYENPALLTEQTFASVGGPEVSTSTPFGSPFGRQVIALLDQSGLSRLAAGTTNRPPWYSFSYNVED